MRIYIQHTCLLLYSIFVKLYQMVSTSDANDKRFFSPPDKLLVFPGIPINVSEHLARPNYQCTKVNEKLVLIRE